MRRLRLKLFQNDTLQSTRKYGNRDEQTSTETKMLVKKSFHWQKNYLNGETKNSKGHTSAMVPPIEMSTSIPLQTSSIYSCQVEPIPRVSWGIGTKFFVTKLHRKKQSIVINEDSANFFAPTVGAVRFYTSGGFL